MRGFGRVGYWVRTARKVASVLNPGVRYLPRPRKYKISGLYDPEWKVVEGVKQGRGTGLTQRRVVDIRL